MPQDLNLKPSALNPKPRHPETLWPVTVGLIGAQGLYGLGHFCGPEEGWVFQSVSLFVYGQWEGSVKRGLEACVNSVKFHLGLRVWGSRFGGGGEVVAEFNAVHSRNIFCFGLLTGTHGKLSSLILSLSEKSNYILGLECHGLP